ncbi:MAG: FtsX-like permease family protein [Anaerolineaceae bacterium]|nr:FtsX-like permease family protein [Anaerolineaceae bacterium]
MFYLRYAMRSFWRNRRWSLFAVFSIAAGVAAIVALRSLGLAIGDSLTGNLRASNHGDITISVPGEGFGVTFGFGGNDQDDRPQLDAELLDGIDSWVRERDGEWSAWTASNAIQIASPDSVSSGRPQFVTTFFVDSDAWPVSHEVVALDPPGAPLSSLLTGGDEVVVSQNLADQLEIAVGDLVRVSGTEEEFTVRGIVATDYEASLRNPLAAFFGFAYLNYESVDKLALEGSPNRISIALPPDQAPATREEADTMTAGLRRLTGGGLRYSTVPALREENRLISDLTGQFIVVMGLGAMLIGGVGIVNTMLVMVRRRTLEIASLKTFGMKGRRIALLFLTEGLLMGLAGSLLGAVLGFFLSRLANQYGEALIQQPLAWSLQPEALLFGMVIGLIVSGVFGVLPVLTALRVRPGIILRPNETVIPRTGLLHSLLALLLIVVTLGLIAGQILANPLAGIIGTALTLLLLGLLIGLLWLLVWVVGRMPAFGNVDLRLALRNLRSGRTRTATTLLALSAGMFALSSITFFGAGTRQILQTTLSESLGGNVMIFTPLPSAIVNPLIESRLDGLEGVRSTTRILNYSGEVIAINGEATDSEEVIERARQLRRDMRNATREGDLGRIPELGAELDALPDYTLDITVRDTTGVNLNGNARIVAGRPLDVDDIGQPVLLLSEEDQLVNVGGSITLKVGDEAYVFEAVGVQASSNLFQGPDQIIIPPGVLPAGDTGFPFTLVDVEDEHLDAALLSLSALPLVFTIDVGFIDGLIGRFIDQFSALPILVGLLSLGAAGIIMANTVALATLERRRQIGILKAVGLKGRRVLGVMLLENLIISLLGGLLGLGLSALGVAIMSRLGIEATILIPDDATPVAIALVIAAVGIGALATLLSARVAIRERALIVLRYE